MESNFSNNDFEQYVKQNADQYRMFPSEKVWKGVNNALHTRRKWYAFWLGFILLVTGGAVTWVMTGHPALNKQDNATAISTPGAISKQKIVTGTETARIIEDLLPFNKQQYLSENPISIQDKLVDSETNLPPRQDVTEIQSPATNIEHLSNSGVKGEPSLLFDNLSSTNNIVDAQDYAIVFGAEQAIIIHADKSSHSKDNKQPLSNKNGPYPLTIESVINAYQVKKTPKKVSWQLFITPTISYRKLSVNKSINNPSAFNYPFASLSDVNSAVTHKPDVGLQIGLSGRYPITKDLKVRGGFQFNINRYDIKAYAFNGEVATIDLNGGPGNSTISTWTNYRNFSGYRSDWLKNFYFSVSVPIGAELKLFGNSKTNVGVAGTLQPTYVLSDNAYLISTDFKNYAEVPRLIRHVNLNTSFETFVNYTSGKTNWQVGPQVRYQILSSFQNKYPVKENLFDFGVKVGVTLNK